MKMAGLILLLIGVGMLVLLMPLSDLEAKNWFFGRRGGRFILMLAPSMIVIGSVLVWVAG